MTCPSVDGEAAQPSTDDSSTPPLPEFDVTSLRSLFNEAQSGRAVDLADRCGRWDEQLAPEDPRRWWVLVVWFVTVQSDARAGDPLVLAERMLQEATRTRSTSAETVARAARALTRASLGQPASAVADLGRATALLGALSTAARDDETPAELYVRTLAANLLGLGLMRSGLYAEARNHLRAMLAPEVLADADAMAPAVARFNIGWTHLSDGLEASTSGDAQRAKRCFTESARWFAQTLDEPVLRAPGSWLRTAASALGAAAGDLADHPSAPAALDAVLQRGDFLRPDHAAICRLASARRRRLSGDPEQAAIELARAEQSLPAQHAHRSISFAVWAESILLEQSATSSPARDDALVDTLEVLVAQRRRDRQALDADYAQATERARLLLNPADLTSISIDALTGVRDRRALPELEQLVAQSNDDGSAGCLAFLDLDDLKQLNDRHSHQLGDEVLRLFGAELRHILRPGDLAVRYGGDEFVVLLRSRSLDGTHQLLDAMVSRFADSSAALPGVDGPVTFSRGISETGTGTNLSELLLQADQDLLHSKHSRHRAVFLAHAQAAQGPPGQSASDDPEMSS